MSSHARILTSVPRHPKFLRAGPAASWLWLAGVCYCQDALTDGFISTEAIHALGVPKPLPLAAVLVRERLWQPDENGWRIHDYLDHNNSAEYINKVRQERKAAGSKGGSSPRRALIRSISQRDEQFASDLLEQLPEQTGEPTFFGTTINGTEEQEHAPNGAETSINDVRTRMLRKERSRETDDGKPAVRVIAALARHIIAAHPDYDEGELMDAVKVQCARANLEYAGVVGAAIDRARAQLHRKPRQEAHG